MKKVIFGLMATVLLSTSAFAINSVENDNCDTIKCLAYDLAISEGATDANATTYSDIVYKNCIESSSSSGNSKGGTTKVEKIE